MPQNLSQYDLDANGNPVKKQAPVQQPHDLSQYDLDDYGNPVIPTHSFAGDAWKALNEPLTDLPSRFAKQVSGAMEHVPTMQQTGQGGIRDWAAWADATAKGFFQGATEGAGDLATGFTSPLGIATLALPGASNVALKAGLPEIASGLTKGLKLASLPFAGHGAKEVYGAGEDIFDPNKSWGDVASRAGHGLVEFAGGVTGARHVPTTEGPIMRRLFPTKETEPNVSPLVDKLGESLAKDKARTPSAKEPTITLPAPWDKAKIKELKTQGYQFTGIDPETGAMTLSHADAGPPAQSVAATTPPVTKVELAPDQPFDNVGAVRHAPRQVPPEINPETGAPYLPWDQPEPMTPVGEIPQQQPTLPGVGLEEGPMEGGFNRPGYGTPPPPSGLPPRFAYHDAGMFNPPEPFYHLPDDSTISGQEMDRRGIPRPETPPFEQQVLGEPTPPPFAQQVMGDQPISNRDMFRLSESIGQQPSQPTQFQMPHEFAPDIVQNQQFVPETEGHTPLFNQRVPQELPPAEPGFMDRVNQFFRDETGEGDIGPEEEGPLWAKAPKTTGTKLRETAQKLREKFGQNALHPLLDEPAQPTEGNAFAQDLIDRSQGLIESTIKSNTRHSARELTSGYNQGGPQLPAIMAREGIQNALDAFKDMPGITGQISIQTTGNVIKVTDNGIGMSPQELDTVFTTLHESGKTNDPNAIGGKGVGKAPYILGGSYFKVVSVKDINGSKIESSFEGIPDEFFVPGGVKIKYREVDPRTPTGTDFETTLDKSDPGNEQMGFYADSMMRKIERWSRGLKHEISLNEYGTPEKLKLKSKADDASIIHEDVGNGSANVEVLIPKDEKTGTRNSIDVHYLNDGFFQFDKRLYLTEDTPGIPENIIVDLKSLVPESSKQYPFPVQRESIKEPVATEIEELIKAKLVNPFASKKKMDLAKLWNQMPTVQNPSGTRPTVFFDPGDRLTPAESLRFQQSPVVQNLTQAIDRIIEEVLGATGSNDWRKKLERVGIILSNPGEYGIHIPNPQAPKGSPKSAILVNPFANIRNPRATTPMEAAVDMVVTMMHETAHIGTENPTTLPHFTPEDLADPRVGRFLQTYMKEVMEQGGIDQGHPMSFVHRLGEIYAKYGTRRFLNASDRIHQLITDPISGQYSPEVQRLLQIFDESRGRPATTEDILSGTGVKSADTGQPGENDVSGNDTGLSGGVPRNVTIRQQHATPENVKTIKEMGYEFSHADEKGNFVFNKMGEGGQQPILESEVPEPPKRRKKGEPKEQEKINPLREAFELPRALMSVDPPYMTSAMFRQGLPMVGTKAWFKAAYQQARVFHNEMFGKGDYYDMRTAEMNNHPLFKPRGKKASIAKEWGVNMTDIGGKLTTREEAIKSQIVERIPGGIGKYIKASNRAFTVFLNELRVNTLDDMVKLGQADAKAQSDISLDPLQNKVLGKEMADFINDATGRSALKTKIAYPTYAKGKFGLGAKEYNIESGAGVKVLSDVFFSPRLIASRIRMMNPSTYVMASPQIRKAYINSMLRTVGLWWGVSSLGELLGGSVSKDPNNADYGKIKIGDTRLDPGGGFQQWLVLGSRMRPDWMKLPIETETGITPIDLMTNLLGTGGGKYTSSGSGQSYEFGVGYKPETRTSVFTNFLAQKLHPTAKFIWDLGSANEQIPVYVGDRLMQLFLPMVSGDMAQLAVDDPMLIPLVVPFSGMGGGTQTYTGKASKPSITPFLGQVLGEPDLPNWDLALGQKQQ